MDSLTLKRHDSSQNKNNRKATHAVLLPDLQVTTRSLKFQ